MGFVKRLSTFEASKYKVSNREFLEFVVKNGYGKREFWTEEGWEWVQFKQAKHPVFWVCPNGCKSECGGVIASYTHCKNGHFILDDFEPCSTGLKNNENTYEVFTSVENQDKNEAQTIENEKKMSTSISYK